MKKAIFYHAGCQVCVSTEQDILNIIPKERIEVVHLGIDTTKVKYAEDQGVQSVPALVMPNGNVLHINFGASIEDLK